MKRFRLEDYFDVTSRQLDYINKSHDKYIYSYNIIQHGIYKPWRPLFKSLEEYTNAIRNG